MGWISMIQPVLWESRISNISGRLLTSILVSRYAPGRVGRHTIQHIYAIIFIIFNLRHRVFLFFVFDYPIKHPLCAPIALPVVSLVVFVAAHFPEVRFHRFLASGGVFLHLYILHFDVLQKNVFFSSFFAFLSDFCRFLCEFVIFPKLFENFQYLRKEPAMR